MESVAKDNEGRLGKAVREWKAAEDRLAEYERKLLAPRGDNGEHSLPLNEETRRKPHEYRRYSIRYDRKPLSGFGDWTFSHVDYDGAPDGGDHRVGYGETVKDCREEIDAQYEDLELDENGDYTRDGLTLLAGTHE
jgi:hypothetical protein